MISYNKTLEDSLDHIGLQVLRAQHPDDHMKGRGLDIYLAVGRSALRNTLLACAAGQLSSVKSILDFGCGAGRVSRWLRAAFPEAELVVSDIRRPFVDFCAENFSGTRHYSNPDFTTVQFPMTFDLIWSGSLITHLPEEHAIAALELMYAALNPKGVMIVTTHGRTALQAQLSGRHKYVEDAHFAEILRTLIATGFGHASPRRSHIGISMNTTAWAAAWCERSLSRRLVYVAEKGWADHQDVIAIVKAPV